MKKKVIHTKDAPPAAGPYEQGIVFQDLLFCSGQIPLTSGGTLVSGDIREEARQCLRNLEAICKEAGTDFSKALKMTVYLTDLSFFPAVNEVYAECFKEAKPARACLGVKELPKNARIEIEGIFAV